MENILVINPGSTSTKIAWFQGENKLWQENIEHSAEALKEFSTIYDQLPFRYSCIMESMEKHGSKAEDITAIASRGGLLPPPVKTGAYEITEDMVKALREHPVNHHASNVGAGIALKMAAELGIKAYIYDAVTADEMTDVVRITGLKDIMRIGQGHNLNMRAAAISFCEEAKLDYKRLNIVVAHLGGGITISLHEKGRITDLISDEEGAFSPERAGAIPTYRLLNKIYSEGYDSLGSAMKLLQKNGGLTSHLGTSDARQAEQMAQSGDEYAALVLDAMALNISRYIASRSTVANGDIDYIILTGGIAYSKYITEKIEKRVKFIAPVEVVPGEHEMEALAKGILRVIRGEEKVNIYK